MAAYHDITEAQVRKWIEENGPILNESAAEAAFIAIQPEIHPGVKRRKAGTAAITLVLRIARRIAKQSI